jgi:hypothetical protein
VTEFRKNVDDLDAHAAEAGNGNGLDCCDVAECAQFLRFWAEVTGAPHITLVAILPDTQGVHARTFPRGTEDTACAWIADYQASGRNVYFQPNETKPDCDKKPAKADMVAALCRHCDIDPDDARFPLAEERERLAQLATFLTRCEQPPTCVIDSGNGVQVLWATRREVLTPEVIARVEAETAALERSLGAGGTHNIDRLLRLPGTANFPNRSKLAKGRGVTRARLIFAGANLYGIDQPDSLVSGQLIEAGLVRPRPPSANAAGHTVDPPEVAALIRQLEQAQEARTIGTVEDLPDDLRTRLTAAMKLDPESMTDWDYARRKRLANRWAGLIDDLRRDASRSAADMSLAAMLKAAGFSHLDTALILLAFRHGKANNEKWSTETLRFRHVARSVLRSHEPPPPELPDLHVLKSDLPLVSRKLRDQLTTHPRMFERGGPARLVTYPPEDARPTEVPPFGVEAVIHAAHEVCRPYQVDHRGKRTNITLPEQVARLYLALNGRWNLRPLHGICCSVLLENDGSIHAHEGYHAPSGLWCTRAPTITVPERPTKQEANAALYRLRKAMRTFTFKGAPLVAHDGNLVVDIEEPPRPCESAALCALLTGVTRASLPLAPGVMINAPALSGSGAGKGLLARMIASIAFGVAPKAGTAGHDEMELEKRIGAMLMRGDPVILLDNLNNTLLRSPQLESCLTEPEVSVRVFGKLEMQDIRTTALLLVTGNGLQASGDSARRYIYPTLEPPVDDPEQRKYAPGFLDGIFARRKELLSDCLTIWRYGRQQKLPRGKPFGSYERWTEWVRDTLLALGCADPVDAISEVRERDPARVSLAALFEAWASKHGGWVKADELDFTVRQLVDDKERPAAIRKRLNELIGTRLGGYELRGKPDGKGKHKTWSYRVVQN